MNRLLLIGIITAMGTVALPARASAQSAAPALELPDHPATPALTRPDPQQYLGTAKQLLDGVPAKSLGYDGQTKLSQLREDFTNLLAKYQTHSLTAPSSAVSVPLKNVVDWKMKFADVERDLTLILGSRSSLGVSSTTAVGTTGGASSARPAGADSSTGLAGVPVSEIGVKNLNPGVRMQLEQVRTSVELFYDATGRIP